MDEYQVTISVIRTKDGHPVENSGGGVSRTTWHDAPTATEALQQATKLAVDAWNEYELRDPAAEQRTPEQLADDQLWRDGAIGIGE